jgi:uncharacterized protein YegP (UPF0339 family)
MIAKNKPGIHLHKTTVTLSEAQMGIKPEFYWHIVARNGRIIARSSETYTRKSGAVKSIKVASEIFRREHEKPGYILTHAYYDHSKPNSPLQSYL